MHFTILMNVSWNLRFVINNFQTLYDKRMHSAVYEDYVRMLKPYIDMHTIVIDCGCGSGHLTSHLEKLTQRVYAFDLDPMMIELARLKTKKVTYQVHDMESPWPFFGDVIVMSMDVINFSKHPFRVLKHAISALNDTGVICLDVYQNGIDLNYEETSLKPFPHSWKLSHEKDMIVHNISTETFHVTIKQFVHNVKDIITYLENQGFQIKASTGLDTRKTILICQR